MSHTWTKQDLSNTPWLNVQQALFQIKNIEAGARDFDFAYYAAMWVKTPEASEHSCGGELSIEAQHFFADLQQLRCRDPLNALRVIAILERNGGCIRYSDKLASYVRQTLSDWLLDGQILTSRQRIRWALACWQDWKATYNSEYLYRPLVTLLMREADVDPGYAMACVEEIKLASQRINYSGVFSDFVPQLEACLYFSRQVEHIQPLCLVDCLLRVLTEARHDYRQQMQGLGESFLRDCANELYDIVSNRVLPREKQEEIYRDLIRYADLNLSYYSNLHGKLWAIESSKPLGERSWSNHQIICINQAADMQLVRAVRASYADMLNTYQSSIINQEYVVQYTHKVLEQISDALHAQYSRLRNIMLSQPSYLGLVEDCIAILWQMIAWLRQHHGRLYFDALETAIENVGCFHVEETNKIAARATTMLVNEFAELVAQDKDGGFYLFAYMIARTEFSSIDKRIGPVLDQIYPILLKTDPARTMRIIKSVHTSEYRGHAVLWMPSPPPKIWPSR